MPRGTLVGVAATVLLAACQEKATLEGSRVEYMTVEGRKFEVRIATTGVPDEYRLLVVRATLVINPDPGSEAERGWVVAGRVMDQTCKGRPHQVLENGIIDTVNLEIRFRCRT